MGRIEEALRRARSSVVDAIPPVSPIPAFGSEIEEPPVIEVEFAPVVQAARVVDAAPDAPVDLAMDVDFLEPMVPPVEIILINGIVPRDSAFYKI